MSNTNRLFDFLPGWKNTEVVRQLAARLAQQCRAVVLDCVRQQATAMTLDKLRGYIRAYATTFVSAALVAGDANCELPNGSRSKVISAAVDQLIDLVIDDLQNENPRWEIFSAAA
jgi:hypothetical protein